MISLSCMSLRHNLSRCNDPYMMMINCVIACHKYMYICVYSCTSDPSLTLSNMTSALDSLPNTLWEEFGGGVDVPQSKVDEIHSQFNNDGERKKEVFRVYVAEHPYPTWRHVSYVLYVLGEDNQQYHSVLEQVQSMFPTGECLLFSSHFSPSVLFVFPF